MINRCQGYAANNEIKVCLLIAQLQSGGAARATLSLGGLLVGSGYQVQILVTREGVSFPYDKRIEVDAVFKSYEIKPALLNRFFRRPLYVFRLLKYAFEKRPEWLVSVMWGMSLRTLILAWIVGAKAIVLEHTTINAERGLNSFFARRILYPFFKRVVVLSHQDYRLYQRSLSNITVIPNSISPDLFFPSLIEQSNGPTLFAVADLSRPFIKGLDYLLDIFDLIKQEFPGVKLRIACASMDKFEEANSSVGLRLSAPSVETLGFLSEPALAREYRSAWAVLATSRYEGFSLVLAEAMACGAAVVSFDCEFGPKEIVEDCKTGFLVPTGDIHTFAERISDLFCDKSLRLRIGEEAKESARRFHPSNISIYWEKIFTDEG